MQLPTENHYEGSKKVPSYYATIHVFDIKLKKFNETNDVQKCARQMVNSAFSNAERGYPLSVTLKKLPVNIKPRFSIIATIRF